MANGEVGEIVARGPRMIEQGTGADDATGGHDTLRLAFTPAIWLAGTRTGTSTWRAGRGTLSSGAAR